MDKCSGIQLYKFISDKIKPSVLLSYALNIKKQKLIKKSEWNSHEFWN
jgi:hypothetical protein